MSFLPWTCTHFYFMSFILFTRALFAFLSMSNFCVQSLLKHTCIFECFFQMSAIHRSWVSHSYSPIPPVPSSSWPYFWMWVLDGMQSGPKSRTKRLAQIAGFLQQRMFLSPWATWGKTLELKFLLLKRNLARSSHDSTDKANMKAWSCSPSSCIMLFSAYLSVRLWVKESFLPRSIRYVLCCVCCVCVCVREREREINRVIILVRELGIGLVTVSTCVTEAPRGSSLC